MIAKICSIIRAVKFGCVLFVRAKHDREQANLWRLSND